MIVNVNGIQKEYIARYKILELFTNSASTIDIDLRVSPTLQTLLQEYKDIFLEKFPEELPPFRNL